jgi:hypothetical protein
MTSIRRKGSVHAHNEHVRSEKGNQKKKTESGSQTGLENEKKQSRHQTGGAQERAGFRSRELKRELAITRRPILVSEFQVSYAWVLGELGQGTRRPSKRLVPFGCRK